MDRVHNLVQYYSIDWLRIDTAKRIQKDFWPEFSKATCVFMPSEVLVDGIHCCSNIQVSDRPLAFDRAFH